MHNEQKSDLGTWQNPFLLELSCLVNITSDDIDDIMCSALEGGICYWCREAEVVGEYLGEYAHEQISRGGTLRLYDSEDDDETYMLDRDRFLQGLKLFIEGGHSDLVSIKNQRIDPCEFDADCADCIIQLAVFGKLVYS